MKHKLLFLLIAILVLFTTSFSQNCPPNIDFELGDFSNWECFTGTTEEINGHNIITLSLSGPTPGRHEIISAATFPIVDPYGGFPKLCPYGSLYSVKLGNDRTNAEAEGLCYRFKVPTTVDTFTFTYFYAVVFEDPQHALYEQPRFFVTAYDVASGNVINCASFDYVANGAIPGFQPSPVASGVLFKSWTPASLQFAGLAGRDVRLEFKTADCTKTGHFGYAYVDVGKDCSNILATAPYCIETNSFILNAPYGYQSYTWYDQTFSTVLGNQQSITLSPPPATSGIFYVGVVPYPGYGCSDTLQSIVTPLPVPDTPVAQSDYVYCQFQSAPSLTATALQGNDLLWYTSATGGTGSTNAPVPPTSAAGTFVYYVSQKVLFGCESFRKKITVRIVPTPVASFSINANRQCQNGNQFIFTSTSANLNNSSYTWDFGDGEIYSSTDAFASHAYATATSFTIKLKVENAGLCSNQTSHTVMVVPKPVADFNYPPIICEKQTLITISDNSSVPGGVATINKWWWNIDGLPVQTQHPGSFIATSPGALPVRLVVTTTEGCRSDTTDKKLSVHNRPAAAFKYSSLLCNNETIRFTDLSFLPQGATGGPITSWYWQFDNNTYSTLQHPSTNFTAGNHRAKLVTETNLGCKSLVADSAFIIHVKPQVQLIINDSCVFIPIKYSAADLLNNVDKWYWNFGNGLYQDASMVSKIYSKEGYSPFTLIAQSINGCKDTLVRPFTIYDNKAFAGRDTIAAIGEPVQLHAHGGPNVRYTWTPSNGLNNATLENPVATLDKDEHYFLYAETDKKCISKTSIKIKRYKGPEIYIPTAFTPNNDGLNDIFKVIPVGIKAFNYFAVFNRYGEKVYYTTNYTQGWNGLYKGAAVGSGTFVVIAQAIDFRGKVLFRKGTVTLLR